MGEEGEILGDCSCVQDTKPITFAFVTLIFLPEVSVLGYLAKKRRFFLKSALLPTLQPELVAGMGSIGTASSGVLQSD